MQMLARVGRSAGARAQWIAWYVSLGLMWAQEQLMTAMTPQRPPRRQRAQAFIEYAILAGLLGVAVIVALTAFGPQVAGVFNRFGVRLGGMG